MSQPVPILSMATSRCWTAARDPGPSEDAPIQQCEFWFNTDTQAFFMCCSDSGENGLEWMQVPLSAKK
jgi:hypothetical protein